MCNTFEDNLEHLSPSDLDSLVTLLKKLNASVLAEKAINHYIKVHRSNRAVFDITAKFFHDDIKDCDVRLAFANQLATYPEDRNPADILIEIARKQGWNPDDIEYLAQLSDDDYYRMFKTYKNKELRNLIAGCFLFDSLCDATASMRRVSNHAKNALRRIGAESLINAHRVSTYDIVIEDPSTSES